MPVDTKCLLPRGGNAIFRRGRFGGYDTIVKINYS